MQQVGLSKAATPVSGILTEKLLLASGFSREPALQRGDQHVTYHPFFNGTLLLTYGSSILPHTKLLSHPWHLFVVCCLSLVVNVNFTGPGGKRSHRSKLWIWSPGRAVLNLSFPICSWLLVVWLASLYRWGLAMAIWKWCNLSEMPFWRVFVPDLPSSNSASPSGPNPFYSPFSVSLPSLLVAMSEVQQAAAEVQVPVHQEKNLWWVNLILGKAMRLQTMKQLLLLLYLWYTIYCIWCGESPTTCTVVCLSYDYISI